MRRPLPALILVVTVACALSAGCGDGGRDSAPPVETEPAPPVTTPAETEPTETAPTTPATTTPVETQPLPPAGRPMSWQAAGAFVWHENDVDPGILGTQLRDNGFGWAVVFLHDGTTEDPVEADWVQRFRAASGLPVGGWGVLRTAPRREAALADALVRRYALDFYVANAEAEYGYTGTDGQSGARYRRSGTFVAAFRALQPTLPAGLSSYCRADMHDLDWGAWRGGGFVFLPQAYVNDLGDAATPAECARGAAAFFPVGSIHPTIGMHPGVLSSLDAATYAPLLARAGTTGFSVYLAETRMTPEEWRALGSAIGTFALAK